MVRHDNTEVITVVPCDCGDCTGTILVVEKRLGRKVRKLEMTLAENDLNGLIDAMQKIKEYHAKKGHDTRWPQCEMN